MNSFGSQFLDIFYQNLFF